MNNLLQAIKWSNQKFVGLRAGYAPVALVTQGFP